MSLSKAFQEFKARKEQLRSIHNDTIKCFDQIQGIFSARQDAEVRAQLSMLSLSSPGSPNETDAACSTADVRLRLGLTDELYTPDEKDEVQRLFSQDPALIIVGQTNCGKSTIINTILDTKSLPTSDRPCTARIVRLTYSEEPYMKLQARDGTILEQSDLKGKSRVPRSKIDLQQTDREDANKAGASLVVGLNIDFLKAGVDIIDSPGKNENQVLDNLVKEQLENVLPVIIYVVDGHNLFTNQDRTTLSDIKSQGHNLDIFYVVSKIEPEERLCSDDEDEERYKQADRVQDRKQQRVREKLIKDGFIRADDTKNKERFHGLSAWKINKWHKLKRENPNWNDPSYDEYIEGFERFKECLQDFCEASLQALIERVSSVLIKVQSRCLDFFIKKANALHKDSEAVMATLKKATKEEKTVNERIISDLENRQQDIAEVIKSTIEEAREEVLQEAAMFKYDNTKLTERITGGVVSGKAAVTECRSQIQSMVATKLQAEVKVMLLRMFSTRDCFVKDLEKSILDLEEAMHTDEESPSTAARALSQSLVTCYEVNVERFVSYMRIGIWQSFKEMLGAKVPVGKAEWKREVASKVLDGVSSHEVAKHLVGSLRDHFIRCHNIFEREVEKIVTLFKRGETVKDQQRGKIRKLAPEIAMLEMLTHNVVDQQKFGVPQKGELIGSGGQGNVYACPNITTSDGSACVVKIVRLSDAQTMKDLSLELHNTRALSHPNVLPLVCSIMFRNDQSYFVSLVSERMKCDLQQALPSISSLRARLVIALDVAKGLQYLHKEDMVHRDVKTQNVLLDENNRAKLTDLGLCKPEGLTTGSLVGTVPNMAPEMILQEYGRSVDVYAFGLLLWRVCEGQGKQPENLHWHISPMIMLLLNAMQTRTPERVAGFPDSCWQLMEKCWGASPKERPSFDNVIRDLEDILKDPRIQ